MRAWLRQPIVLTRRVAIAVGLVIGLLAAGGIVGATIVSKDIRDDRRTDAEIARIARRIIQIERPTERQIVKRIVRDLDACKGNPRCGRTLQEAIQAADHHRNGPAPPADPRRTRPQGPTTDPRSPRPPRAPPRPPRDRPGPRPPRRPPPGGVEPEPPPPPRQPVDVQIPDIGPVKIPPICTPAVGINCRR